ncbi:MAG: hypothetical protein IT539_08015 [Bradyrhizobiaceae bacterium]|nr:hypothetical protein [Bradyrhizobiaceae bacterium]
MTEILGGFAFLLLLAAQVFAVAVLNGRSYSRDGRDKCNAGAAARRRPAGVLNSMTPVERYVDQCRTQRSRYLAALFRQASPD